LIGELHRDGADEAGHPIVDRGSLRAASDYEGRFAELEAAGYDWINLSLYGSLQGKPLVVVELPSRAVGAARPSINFSGPTRAVSAQGGAIDDLVTFKD